MFLLIVLYYTTLVEPMFDWYVFGVAYFLGTLTMARENYRLSGTKQSPPEIYQFMYIACLLWPIYTPIKFIIWFTVSYVTFGNPLDKKAIEAKEPYVPVKWEGTVVKKIEGRQSLFNEIYVKFDNGEIKKVEHTGEGMWYLATGRIFGIIKENGIYLMQGIVEPKATTKVASSNQF